MDRVAKDIRSRNMVSIRAYDTKPELTVRRLVHRMGYRYVLRRDDLPGKPDLVFPRRSKVIFVHGCFWHQHAKPSCGRSHQPRSRLDYWMPKLKRTIARDAQQRRLLHQAGWKTLIVWECDTGNLSKLERAIQRFLS